MASKDSLTVRIDPDVKRNAEELFEELGLSMNAAINIFLKQAVYKGGFPFEIVKQKKIGRKEKPLYKHK